LTSAPWSTSSFTISPWLCDAAHISADWPPQLSLRFTWAPCFSSTFAASTRPERAAAIRAVWPEGFGESGSAPALSSASRIGALPTVAASIMADAP